MKCEFNFELDQVVTTPFDKKGIVTMLGFDSAGNQVAVKTDTGIQWYKENEISKAE